MLTDPSSLYAHIAFACWMRRAGVAGGCGGGDLTLFTTGIEGTEASGSAILRVLSESSRTDMSLAVGSLFRIAFPSGRESSPWATRNSTFWRVCDTMCASKAAWSGIVWKVPPETIVID